jgi:hypothetical protein
MLYKQEHPKSHPVVVGTPINMFTERLQRTPTGRELSTNLRFLPINFPNVRQALEGKEEVTREL